MSELSTLRLRRTRRAGIRWWESGRTERTFLDYVVDGASMYSAIVEAGLDDIGRLGWGDSEMHRAGQDCLLGVHPPEFASDQVALFVCPECGDLGCGAVTAQIRRRSDTVTWERIAMKTIGQWRVDPLDLGPYTFDREAYDAVIEQAEMVDFSDI